VTGPNISAFHPVTVAAKAANKIAFTQNKKRPALEMLGSA
jgi:hypothetical protein